MGKDQELMEAARVGNAVAVAKLLDHNSKRHGPFSSFRRSPSINAQDMNGYSPLHHACLNGHVDIVRLLLAHDARPDIPDIRGSTPLYLASWANHGEIAKLLLMHPLKPANPNSNTIDNETPLHCAAQHGHNTAVAILLSYGADPTLRNNSFQTPLDLAAQFGRLQVVQILIRTHPELLAPFRLPKETLNSDTDAEGSPIFTITPTKHIFTHTCLHLASRNGHKKVVQTLLAAGVYVNTLTNAGTALHEAALCGKKSVVETLLEAGVDPSATDGNGRTALDILKAFPPHVTYEIVSTINDFCRQNTSAELFKPIRHTIDLDETEKSSDSGEYELKIRTMPKPIIKPMQQNNITPTMQRAVLDNEALSKTLAKNPTSPIDANNNKKHSPTPEFPPPSVTQAEHAILEFIRPQSTTKSKRKSLQIKNNVKEDLEKFILETINQLDSPDSLSSRVSDCVEEFVGDVPFAGLFKGSTLNLALDESNPLSELPTGLRSPSLVRSIQPKMPKQNLDRSKETSLENLQQLNDLKIWDEIDTLLESIGNEVSNTKQIEELKTELKTKTPPNTPCSAKPFNIRKPSDLLLGTDESVTQNWCHAPNTLIYGQILYDVTYLGSTVIKELEGTVSTRKSIKKFKRSDNARESNPLEDCHNTTKMLKESGQNGRSKVGISISFLGVKFIDVEKRTTICMHDIENINCVCQDPEDLRYFAYITKEDDSYYCHVFMVDNLDLTREIILTLGQAFEVAYQLALNKEKTSNECDSPLNNCSIKV